MTILLFRLANVPDEEVQEIRELLQQNNIQFYETDAGFFRVGLDAIWLRDKSQLESARELMQAYQQQRRQRQQEIHAELVAEGKAPTAWQLFRVQPLRYLGLLLIIAFVLAISLLPFVFLMF
jgi:hypothetical protein